MNKDLGGFPLSYVESWDVGVINMGVMGDVDSSSTTFSFIYVDGKKLPTILSSQFLSSWNWTSFLTTNFFVIVSYSVYDFDL